MAAIFFSNQLKKKRIQFEDQRLKHYRVSISIVNHKLTFVISTINEISVVFILSCKD